MVYQLELAPATKSVLTSEQLFFQISKQAVALKHFNADSMASGPQTRLGDSDFSFIYSSKTDKWKFMLDSSVGDYQALQAGWAQLRESLASQGIRLSPLHNSLLE
jgi:hypothetical protein